MTNLVNKSYGPTTFLLVALITQWQKRITRLQIQLIQVQTEGV